LNADEAMRSRKAMINTPPEECPYPQSTRLAVLFFVSGVGKFGSEDHAAKQQPNTETINSPKRVTFRAIKLNMSAADTQDKHRERDAERARGKSAAIELRRSVPVRLPLINRASMISQ
jgi:hypothetical protein